ncbi:helix-turn-helix domain-containing protein [Paenibacillus naphthalenovorans]|uniref:helix-turn-helix domain-containing protein n=1 Tax=Paenibacillus naphthalenovorans TaxID=162209 RepID=UPI003D2A32B0
MTFGEILTHLMEKNDVSREELAKKLGVSYWTVSKYATDKRFPDPEIINKIADIFEVSIDYLYGREKQITTQAAHRTDDPMSDLPEEAQKSLREFQEYILRKYGKSED